MSKNGIQQYFYANSADLFAYALQLTVQSGLIR